nr:TIGR01621 family pseudouridine synthase [Actinobacillus delphinicola]
MMHFKIIFQHADFLVIYKPHGVSVHKDEQDTGLTTQLAEQLSVPQIWLVHRLDKVTSGLLILAKNATAAAELSRAFAEHKVKKTYLALSNQKPKKKQGWIKGDMQKARRGAWKLVKTSENPAITYFNTQSLAPNLRLFVLHPHTGKTHQLRVAMKSLGSPILGDALYSGHESDRTYLHAYRLQFCYQGEDFDIQAMPEAGELFLTYKQDLSNILFK